VKKCLTAGFFLLLVPGLSIFGQGGPSDTSATAETKNLFYNLKRMAGKAVLVGHQDALAYGVYWRYQPGRCDVREVTGEYPAVYGWDLGDIEHNRTVNLDSVPFDKMKAYIREAYERGGINTVSWHLDNPLTGKSSWDPAAGTVASILPGGEKHAYFKTWLDQVAAFFLSLKGKKGELIPVIFRPFHELNGDWFWWGGANCEPGQFRELFRFTVNYLRGGKQVHNLLYVYNTDKINSAAAFMEKYPGDDVVDMMSADIYTIGNPASDRLFVEALQFQLGIVAEEAGKHQKLAAFSETGQEAIPYPAYFTEAIYKGIEGLPLSYILFWRNHGKQASGRLHYYVPYPGHPAAADFVKFCSKENLYLERKLAAVNIYAAYR
jgi:hypothetical protein